MPLLLERFADADITLRAHTPLFFSRYACHFFAVDFFVHNAGFDFSPPFRLPVFAVLRLIADSSPPMPMPPCC